MQDISYEQEERQWFESISSIIRDQLAFLSQKGIKESDDLGAFRRFIWEFAGDLDRVEKIALGDIADQDARRLRNTAQMKRRLTKLASSPYFGRIDFKEAVAENETKVYVGTHGLYDNLQNILIHDWRAPVCSLFYDYELGPASFTAPEGCISGEVLIKRQYGIADGKLNYMLDGGLTITDDVLREALARNTSGKMREIAGTIQREQNSVIRNENTRLLIVEGSAGSGKTSVALHRAAYLLYRHRDRLNHRNLMIFSPNDIFSDYISSVLPELGEENIMNATFDECARAILGDRAKFEDRYDQLEFLCAGKKDASYEIRMQSIKFKSSLLFLRILRNYSEHLRTKLIEFKSMKGVDRVTVIVPESSLRRIYREHCAWMPIIPSLERLADLTETRYAESTKRVRRHVASMLLKANVRDLYTDLFSDVELVKEMAEMAELPEDIHAICEFSQKTARRGKMLYEDVAPVILLRGLFDGFMADKSVIHLVIDEAQDYTPVQYEIIKNVFSESAVTLLGDLNQSINPYMNIGRFEHVRNIFSRDTGIIVPLRTSYRSSFEIAEFTQRLLPDDQTINVITRNSQKPVVTDVKHSTDLIEAISADITSLKNSGLNSIAVICKSGAEAKEVHKALEPLQEIALVGRDDKVFKHGVVVVPIYLAKGLEYDGVIVYDAGSHNYTGEEDRKLLYTACTRAMHVLHVYFTSTLSELIPPPDSGVYDVVSCDTV